MNGMTSAAGRLNVEFSKEISVVAEEEGTVNKELKEVRERASVVPQHVQLAPNPQLPEKERSDAPYHWKKFSQGISRF
uniref:Uncharacterized protein n=1 Tax=Sphaerodactylus townsendi TaxID=933632 RepID=A0ACB8EIR5_9SAUR